MAPSHQCRPKSKWKPSSATLSWRRVHVTWLGTEKPPAGCRRYQPFARCRPRHQLLWRGVQVTETMRRGAVKASNTALDESFPLTGFLPKMSVVRVQGAVSSGTPAFDANGVGRTAFKFR